MKKIIASLALITSLISCTSDDESTISQPQETNYATGYFVTNEGIFQTNNADVSFLSIDLLNSENQIFKKANNRNIGDVAQSMAQNEKYVFVVMNNSNTIEVVNKKTFKSVFTITENLQQPRYATISNGKLWVTNSGNNSVSYYSTENFSASGTINLDFNPELIESNDENIYVSSNTFQPSHKLNIYKTTDASLAESKNYTLPINGLSKNGQTIYTLSSDEVVTELHQINATTFEVLNQSTDTSSRFLSYYNNKLYYSSGTKIMTYHIIDESNQEVFSVANTGWSAIYGFNVFDDQIFILDAKNFSEAGEVNVYNLSGQKTKSLKVGIGPNAIYKIQ